MKKLIMVVGIMLVGITGMAFADEPAIVNNPGNAWDNVKKALGTAEPSADILFDTQDGSFKVGSSIRLYSIENVSEKIHVPFISDLDVRVGWLETKGAYATLSLDLARATGVDALKYVHLGWYGGRSFDDHTWDTGPIAGAKVSF